MIEWSGSEKRGYWFVAGSLDDHFIDLIDGSYFVTELVTPPLEDIILAGPFDTLEAAKAALLVML